jgi:hypothetical protein
MARKILFGKISSQFSLLLSDVSSTTTDDAPAKMLRLSTMNAIKLFSENPKAEATFYVSMCARSTFFGMAFGTFDCSALWCMLADEFTQDDG